MPDQKNHSKIEIYVIEDALNHQKRGTTQYFLPATLTSSDTILLSDSEIRSYEIADDTSFSDNNNPRYYLNLTESGMEKIGQLGSVELCCGKKFVITVDRQPIYGGYFWSPFSSHSCDWVIIPAICSKRLSIEAGYPNKFFRSDLQDPRGNQVLLEAFASTGRLNRTGKK